MNQKKNYFPNLNGLRFIAAFLVIIHHIEQFKFISNLDSFWNLPFIKITGKLGVILFFVLSGFLITYLLLAEENSIKTISIRKFYIRRILRIWPLYFLIIILAFLVLPNITLFTLPGFGKEVIYNHLLLKLFLYAIFFPNLVLSMLGVVPYASHTWSIGTEEQFYLVWPVLIKYLKKYRIYLMLLIISCYLLIDKFLNTTYSDFLPYKVVIRDFWLTFNIDCMAIGGFFAVLLSQNNRLLSILLNRNLFYLITITTLILIAKGVYLPYLHYEFYSLLFGTIILNFAANDKIKISLENNFLNYLGNISYGLYMYHPMIIILTLAICKSLNLITNWYIYPLTFVLTFLLAHISYKYYEKYFLKYKIKFSNILSGSKITE
ncbi:peptidoglycan/LPS O-acetylase OafA/YrhL [Flavobacterium sp. 270]|uniref:acyltransferase family protein n=1 Tax=Flavobacterium sp. 270 TaxID=2512114 RepID=UPI001066782B|nr:acyltransferase [Flavobacterium sp. 270]TDW50095.1 peptidoglycan/LPS O-acetylase OafA/YrhL [Flavobacterium sp. 270]